MHARVHRLLIVLMASMLVLAVPAWAQDDGDADDADTPNDTAAQDQYDDARNASCPNPREVASVGPTDDNTVTPFRIEGRTFRVTYDVSFKNPRDSNLVEIGIEDRSDLVDFANVEEDEAGSFVVTEGRGSYELVVNVRPPNGADYAISVEDCRAVSNRGDDDTGAAADTGDIINIPDKKTLAKTGGSPFAYFLALGLIGGGVILLRRT